MVAVACIVTTTSRTMVADHSTQAVLGAHGGGDGGVEPTGHVQSRQGKANPGTDLTGEGKIMPEPLQVYAECVR